MLARRLLCEVPAKLSATQRARHRVAHAVNPAAFDDYRDWPTRVRGGWPKDEGSGLSIFYSQSDRVEKQAALGAFLMEMRTGTGAVQ